MSEVFRLAWFGQLEDAAVEDGGTQRPEVNVIEVRPRTEVNLR